MVDASIEPARSSTLNPQPSSRTSPSRGRHDLEPLLAFVSEFAEAIRDGTFETYPDG